MFFFFKQKTAYEMRISDWSSDVCSSDLLTDLAVLGRDARRVDDRAALAVRHRVERQHARRRLGDAAEGADEVDLDGPVERIERKMLDAAVFLAAARGLDRVAGAGAVDEDAFLPMRFARLGAGGVDRCVVGVVELVQDAD